jgi:prolyl-tRNA editing enzyme YbaK/EbsC (Cys-tRNA(Pro) deacylase)
MVTWSCKADVTRLADRSGDSTMTVAPTLEKYLASKNIKYDVIMHEPTMSSNRTAEACRISGELLAKAVVLRDGIGFILAILQSCQRALSRYQIEHVTNLLAC